MIDAGCVYAHHIIHGGFAHLPETYIVNKNVQDIRALASVLLTKVGQFGLDVLGLLCPRIFMLGLNEVILPIVDNWFGWSD